MAPLETLGFALAGYGCTTCIGNSGPLDDAVAAAIEANDLVVAAVLSGNRNFEGRIHPLARASYLASPPLVVAFALAGRVDIDLTTRAARDRLGRVARLPGRHLAGARRDPVGHRRRDRPRALPPHLRDGVRGRRSLARAADPVGRPLRLGGGLDLHRQAAVLRRHDPRRRRPSATSSGARVLAVLGDSVTTDHISPAGSIAPWSPAGQWLQAHGVGPLEFNSYGARRGHHEVMVRGTFGNIRLRNRLVEGKEGPYTVHLPDGERGVHLRRGDALRGRGRAAGHPRRSRVRLGLVARLGRQGPGAARASAFVHRRELRADPSLEPGRDGHPAAPVPARRDGRVARPDRSRGLHGDRPRRPADAAPDGRGHGVPRSGRRDDGAERRFEAIARLDGPIDVEYYRQGGILPTVLRRLAHRAPSAPAGALATRTKKPPGEEPGASHAEEQRACVPPSRRDQARGRRDARTQRSCASFLAITARPRAPRRMPIRPEVRTVPRTGRSARASWLSRSGPRAPESRRRGQRSNKVAARTRDDSSIGRSSRHGSPWPSRCGPSMDEPAG